MGRPIKKKYIGDQTNNPQSHFIVCTAWTTSGGSAKAGTILRQKTSNRYKVHTSDGTALCKLVTGTPTSAGQMSITVDPYQVPTGVATFTVTMEANAATVVSQGNHGYTTGDVVTVVGGTGTAATLTLTVVSTNITAVTVTGGAKGSYTALPVNPVSVTGGTGSGATFNLTYDVKSIAVGGTNTGYGANTEIQIVGGGFATQATATATVTTGSIVSPLTITANGTGYSSIPTVNALSFGATQYASKINNRTVETFQDHKYKWELDTQSLTGAGTSNGPTSQGTGTLGYALIQSN